MFKFGTAVSVFAFSIFVSSSANALNAGNYMWSDYNTTKDCGSRGVYVGPNNAREHWGTCLYLVSGPFNVHSSYSLTKICNDGGIYAGVNRADLHAGTCLWFKNLNVVSSYTTTRQCTSQNGDVGIYVGPNQPAIHGGSCLYVKSLK